MIPPVDVNRVISNLSEQLANALKDNAILNVLVSQLQTELESLRATQVKEKGN